MRNKTMGYDETKKLLNKLRSFQYSLKKTDIKEQVETPTLDQETETQQATGNQYDDVTVINDVEVKILSPDQEDLKITDEQKAAISQLIDNFKQQVSQIAQFEPGLTINENQIRLDGRLTDEDIGFVYIAGQESGVYLNMDMTKLEEDVKIAIDKLLKFEMTFKTAMDSLIPDRTNT